MWFGRDYLRFRWGDAPVWVRACLGLYALPFLLTGCHVVPRAYEDYVVLGGMACGFPAVGYMAVRTLMKFGMTRPAPDDDQSIVHSMGEGDGQ